MAAAYLLDTHALIWWWLGDPALSDRVGDLLGLRNLGIHVSAVSGLEIALKVRAGKLPAMAEPLAVFPESIAREGFRHLAVDHRHAVRAGLLEGLHKDPFDRLIAAQAQIEDLTVITRDRAFTSFGCKVIW